MSTVKAWWRKADEMVLAFSRDIPRVLPEILISGAEGLNYEVARPEIEEFAKYSSYYIDDGIISFEFYPESIDAGVSKDTDWYVCGSFNGWEAAIGNSVWKTVPHSDGRRRELKVPIKDLKLDHRFGFFKFASDSGKWAEPPSSSPNAVVDSHGNRNFRFSLDRTGRNILVLKFNGACDPTREIRVKIPQMRIDMRVEAAELLRTVYSSKRLGAHRRDGGTEFSIFAPRAKAAYVRHWAKGSENSFLIEAKSDDGAVWVAQSAVDLEGDRYVWHIDGDNGLPTAHFDVRANIVDPYANAFETSSGAGIVKYYDCIPDAPKHFNPPKWHDLSIMEIHLRDVLAKASADLSDDERLTFAGLAKWLKSPGCYIRRAGVNCVELQPVQEFTAQNRADYEWGYMPVGWFAPSSSYASDPQGASQNSELAEVVKAFHDAGIAVIFDVVYNHYGEPNYLSLIDEGYYFETSSDGNLMNFSGCGNDIRAKSPMALRLITDSLRALLEKYGADGFRFDLAELLGFGVLKEIETFVKKIKPSAVLIAEPWSFRGHIGGALSATGYASWNDGFREFMRSYALGSGNFDGFKYFISGSRGGYASFPAQTVNYLESHDDMCLLDRLSSSPENPSREDLRRYKLAYALVFLSIGIPMAAEGFDLVRTKGGLNNTYKNGAANMLDYRRGLRFPGEGRWLRALSKFRLSDCARALRLSKAPCDSFFEFFSGGGTEAGVLFNADFSIDAPRIFAAFNPASSEAELPVPKCFCGFRQIADIDTFCECGIDSFKLESGNGGILKMPPVSLGIWIDR